MNQESNAPRTAPNHQLEKRQTLYILLAMFFVAGWFSAIIGEESSYHSLFQLFFGVLSTVFIVRWVALDAAQIGFKLTTGWIFFFVLFSLLAVPFYLFQTRRQKSLRPILLAFGLLIAYIISATLGGGMAIGFGLAEMPPDVAVVKPKASK